MLLSWWFLAIILVAYWLCPNESKFHLILYKVFCGYKLFIYLVAIQFSTPAISASDVNPLFPYAFFALPSRGIVRSYEQNSQCYAEYLSIVIYAEKSGIENAVSGFVADI